MTEIEMVNEINAATDKAADIERRLRTLGHPDDEGDCEAERLLAADEIARLRARAEVLEAALRGCLDVFESGKLQALIAFATVHGQHYDGPTINIAALRKLLETRDDDD